MKAQSFKVTHVFVALATVASVAFGIVGFATSCKPATLPVEPDVVVNVPDATALVDATPAPAPIADASPSCVNACEELHTLGCSEGADAGACAVACAHVQSAKLTQFDVACMTKAKTKATARTCAGIGASGCQ